jgi:diguanylate cyclase (GGDEF)-like protein/PAS domain S-box-containing protein
MVVMIYGNINNQSRHSHMLNIQHHLTGALKQLGVAALYALLLYVGDLYFESETIVGYFEPASGLALAALLIGGKRYAWGVLLGAILINAISTNSFWAAATITSCDVLQAFCGAWLLTREGHGFDLRLQSLRAYLRLILLGGCASVAIGALAVNSVLLFSRLLAPENYFHSLTQWWMSDTLGVILVAPLILVWWRAKNDWREAGQKLEAVLLLGLTVLVGQIVFLGWLHDSVGQMAKGYWMFMIFFWVAVRLGNRGTVIALVVVAIQALSGAILGTGFFANDIANTHLVNYWFYMFILSAASMALAAYITEFKRAETALRNRTDELALHNHIFKQVNLGVPLCEILEDLAHQIENQNQGMRCSILLPDEDGKPLRHEAAPGWSDFYSQPIKGGDECVLGRLAIYRHKPAQPSDTEIALIERYVDLAAQLIERAHSRDDLHLKNLALNAAANAIVITDKNSRIEWVNQAFGKLTGYSVTEAIGHYPKELLKSGEHSQAFYEKLWETIISGEMWRGEIINRRKDGSLYHEEMTITPVVDEQGEITHFVAVKQDITDRVKAGLALKRYKLVIDTVNDGFWMVDALGNLLEANAVYAKMSGYSADELVNMHISQLEAIEQSVDEVGAHAREVIAQGCTRFETRHRHKDGHEIDVEVSATFMPESQQFFVFIRDITERKQAERQLRESEAHFRAIIEASPIPFALNDEQQNITYLNSSFIRTFGYTLEDIPTLADWWPKAYPDPVYRQWVATTWQTHLEKSKRVSEPFEPLELGIRCKDGGIKTVLAGAAPIGASFAGVHLVSLYDITERKRAENALTESESRFREIFNTVSDAIFIHDAETGRIVDVNRRMCEMYGFTREEALACDVNDLSAGTPPYSTAEAVEKIHLAHTDGPQTFNWLARARDGHLFWVEVSLRFALIGSHQRILAVVRDISERKRAEEELRVAATAFESDDGMMVTDAENVILRVNHAFTEITGYTAEEAVGQTPGMLKSDRHNADFYAAMWEKLRSTGAWNGEIWNQRKNRDVYPAQFTITAVKGDAGEITHYVATLHDITERKAAEAEINNLAFYDTLTQLPNRRMLNDRLGHAMAASKRSGLYGALMFLDLDNFKPLNDTCGHGVGDLLLIEVARRLTGCVRETDTVARFGGDEFVVMLGELDEGKAESTRQAGVVAEKIRTTLAEPYLLTCKHEGEAETAVEHRCAASIGVVLFIGHEAGAEDVVKWADIAMYQAKGCGRNSIRFFEQ